MHRTARVGLHRLTNVQRKRCFGLLRSAADVWSCALELNAWRRQRRDTPLVSLEALYRELTLAGPGAFGELDAVGARSVLRRFSDAWFSAAKRRKAGDLTIRFPRRRRGLMAVRWHHGVFRLQGRRLRLPAALGCDPLWVQLDREVPYPAEQVRSVTLLADGGRLWVDVTAEVPVATYPDTKRPDPDRVAGVDLGIIHPFAVAGPEGQALLVSGRAIRAEHRMHLADTKQRRRAVAKRAPMPGRRRSRRWQQYRRREQVVQGRYLRRVRQAMHEAARMVVDWAVEHRIGTLAVGDPRSVLTIPAGRRHNLRVRNNWRVGQLMAILHDKAELADISVRLVNERGTSSTCPNCRQHVARPAGRTTICKSCNTIGHRDLFAAAIIATRTPTDASGGLTTAAAVLPHVVTHRRAGRHLPGAGLSRRDPRRPHRSSPPSVTTGEAPRGSVGRLWPALPTTVGSRSPNPCGEESQSPLKSGLRTR
ncbi:RNA-guided endonuclease InsQ/TnpB family protein [Dactylosporangium sp. CS-033363]|uniref:RNA-guided endonuclease InsQ/TnpB family protein n=1 Tax=Dactylosporangium sp. CS-033363 TaxID=3239935 RepID=UPI003D8D1921